MRMQLKGTKQQTYSYFQDWLPTSWNYTKFKFLSTYSYTTYFPCFWIKKNAFQFIIPWSKNFLGKCCDVFNMFYKMSQGNI